MSDIPDLPEIPDEDQVEEIKDTCNTSFTIGIIGVGQAGSRLAEAFSKLGYNRVIVLNTASQDLVAIDLPEENKLLINTGVTRGAGKDPVVGTKAVTSFKDQIFDLMITKFGKDVDLILICLGAGGGTGSGGGPECISIAKEYFETLRKEPRVGVLASMPKTGESSVVNKNAFIILESLIQKSDAKEISPLILIDNSKISKLYPRLSSTQFWNAANSMIVGLFHLFNDISSREEGVVSWAFDRADFDTVLRSGIITFGATKVAKYEKATDVSQSVRDNLQKNVLVGDLDLTSAKCAACIFVGSEKILNEIPEENLEYGFEQVKRMLNPDTSVVHRGVYKWDSKDLRVYTIIGGLSKPDLRMREIAKLGRVDDFYGDKE